MLFSDTLILVITFPEQVAYKLISKCSFIWEHAPFPDQTCYMNAFNLSHVLNQCCT